MCYLNNNNRKNEWKNKFSREFSKRGKIYVFNIGNFI